MYNSTPNVPDKASTGIQGLDEILAGGLPRHQTYLVEGESGSGKTTLGLQFLIEGVRQGEEVLYVTLGETEQELRQIAQSHGWSLDGVHIYELTAMEAIEQLASEQTIFHTADVELSEATDQILQAIQRVRPDRVVFDSITEIRLLAEAPLRYRRQIFSMRQLLIDLGCTALFLNNRPAPNNERTLHSLVHGVIFLEQIVPAYGSMRRNLHVSKMRGMPFHEGHHDFRILTGGLEVYPRISPAEKSRDSDWETLSSGVAELDSLLGGGLETGTACLIAGASGTGKSTLATLYAYSAARRGHGAAVFLFDERPETWYRRSENVNMNIRPYVAEGLIQVQQMNTSEISPGEFAHEVRCAVDESGARVIVIDSLSGYANAMLQERLLTMQMHELLAALSQRGVLSLLIVTQHGMFGGDTRDPVDLSYLADSVLLLRHFEAGGSVRQAISVIKKRHGYHEKTIREVSISANGVVLGEPLTDFSGVLTGNPVYTGRQQALLARSERRQEDDDE